jgi:tRNA modification GTPase
MKPSEYALDDPIIAIATALVPAALGIVRASGKGCVELVARRFSRPDALLRAEGNTLVYGWILDGEKGQRIDEVMLAVYRAPKSFTGEDSVEIIGHGGPSVVLAVYRLLIEEGFRAAEKGEFTFRAFANGKTDLTRAEAVREIIDAKTDTARSHAADRLSGSIEGEITRIKNLVLQALAAIEVQIEYPEDEETTKGAFDAKAVTEAFSQLEILESSWAAEKLYHDGARIVLAGRTNAGKSSLFNTLLKEERAIVSDIPGTTRDWLESWIDFGGIPVRLFDTAGLRHTDDDIEAEGVQRSRSLASGADLILYVVDGTEGLDDGDRLFLSETGPAGTENPPLILVWNKSDKVGASPVPQADRAGEIRAVCALSAKNGTGVAELTETAKNILLGEQYTGGQKRTRSTGLGTERQKTAVRNAISFLRHASDAAERGFPMDAVAQDLEDALSVLGEITGEITSSDILDTVFSGFCVGK